MRSLEERKKILELKKGGLNNSEISRETRIPRCTVRDIVRRGDVSQLAEEADSKSVQCEFESHHRHHYSYILGLYLGDGYINREPRCFKIRFFLDSKYPKIIKKCEESLSCLFPKNKVGLVDFTNYVVIQLYSKKLLDFFPQHGSGKKHERKIKLEKWQKEIIKNNPQDFLRGLIHSDGCLDKNIIKGKSYERFTFRNKSVDIINLFKKTCELCDVDVRINHYKRISTASISKRKDVKKMKKLNCQKE